MMRLFAALLLSLFFSCASTPTSTEKGRATQTPAQLASIRESYTPFSRIEAIATISTLWEGAPYDFRTEIIVDFQEGSDEPASFEIVLKDLVFLSELYRLTLHDGQLVHTDVVKNIVTTYDIRRYRWDDLITLPLPLGDLLTFLTTRFEKNFFDNAVAAKEGEYWLVQKKNELYHFYLRNNAIEKIELAKRGGVEVNIEYRGQFSGLKTRPFPKEVQITNQATGEKLSLTYKSVKIS